MVASLPAGAAGAGVPGSSLGAQLNGTSRVGSMLCRAGLCAPPLDWCRAYLASTLCCDTCGGVQHQLLLPFAATPGARDLAEHVLPLADLVFHCQNQVRGRDPACSGAIHSCKSYSHSQALWQVYRESSPKQDQSGQSPSAAPTVRPDRSCQAALRAAQTHRLMKAGSQASLQPFHCNHQPARVLQAWTAGSGGAQTVHRTLPGRICLWKSGDA